MKKYEELFFISSAGLTVAIGLSAFKASRNELTPLWFSVKQQVHSDQGFIPDSLVAEPSQYRTPALAMGEPIFGSGEFECSEKASFVCAALFSTDGSGTPVTYMGSFHTGADRKSTRLNSSHALTSRMPSSA